MELFEGAYVYIYRGKLKMRVLFRAFLLLVFFMIALSVVKFLFVKLFFLGLWIAAIAFLIFIVSSLVKKT